MPREHLSDTMSSLHFSFVVLVAIACSIGNVKHAYSSVLYVYFLSSVVSVGLLLASRYFKLFVTAKI